MAKRFSFSIDDFIEAFEDITKHESDYNSIFDNKTFSKMKEIHDKFGLKCIFRLNGTASPR